MPIVFINTALKTDKTAYAPNVITATNHNSRLQKINNKTGMMTNTKFKHIESNTERLCFTTCCSSSHSIFGNQRLITRPVFAHNTENIEGMKSVNRKPVRLIVPQTKSNKLAIATNGIVIQR